MRRGRRPAHLLLMTGFFVCVAVLTLLLALEAATSPAERLYLPFPQTTVLALGILLLLQLAYRFSARCVLRRTTTAATTSA